MTRQEYLDTWFSGGEIPLSGGVSGQLKLPAVLRCIDILSNSISKLPYLIIDTSNNQKPQDKFSKRLHHLLSSEPNENMSASTFHKLMEVNRLITGNAYAVIKSSNTGMIESLTPINSDSVQVVKLSNGTIAYNVTSTNADKSRVTKQYSADEIIHIKGISFDGIVGTSVLSYARQTTENALLQDEYARTWYKNGGRPMGIINIATDLPHMKKGDDINATKKQMRDKARETWEKHTAGSDNAGRVAVLDNGWTYTAVPQISQKDMAFIESKQMQIEDIAMFFGVPLYKLGIGKQSYASNEQNGIAYVTDTLTPIVTQYEQEYTRKCLPLEKVVNGYSVKINLKAEMRGDIRTQIFEYTALLDRGVFNINEVRALEDMAGIEGGGVYRISGGGQAGQEISTKNTQQDNNQTNNKKAVKTK